MRCDQFAGLSESARIFLAENQPPEVKCEHCGSVIQQQRYHAVIGAFDGMFATQFPLHQHRLKDGRLADEFHQCSPWSFGPVHFIGLRVSDGRVFAWLDKEIEEWI